MKTAIVGGGAAGFFLAIHLKELLPAMTVVVMERAQRVLAKVEISGGGRCNCTNSFEDVSDLSAVYPRGHRLLKRLFNVFSPSDAYDWFEQRGVKLTTQADHCVFPASQDSHSIINCLTGEARRLGVQVLTGRKIGSLTELADYDFVAVTTGGSPRDEGLEWLRNAGVETVAPVPSLFTFSIDDAGLRSLMGAVAEQASVSLAGTKLRAAGPLLVTHWGMSGPAILKLSSLGARLLAEHHYQMPLIVNWTSQGDAEAGSELSRIMTANGRKLVGSIAPSGVPQRLWAYLAAKAVGDGRRWGELSRKDQNRLVSVLTNDNYTISGRGMWKDEFVTCGGVALAAVDAATLESKHVEGLFFAGEVLDIDGVTGGFNFQAAWTTGYVAAEGIARRARNKQ